ncbi:MAG: citrate lyase holo-[Clostridia bacterium]|nr:citrate lyase holo-[acyl-carrier protein] synthase [Clostridia bacterium]
MKKAVIYRPVTLEEMLLCREKRAEQQKELLRRFSAPVISFTMNIPGPEKTSPLIERGF